MQLVLGQEMASKVLAQQLQNAVYAERYRKLRELGWIDSAIQEAYSITEDNPESLDAALDLLHTNHEDPINVHP